MELTKSQGKSEGHGEVARKSEHPASLSVLAEGRSAQSGEATVAAEYGTLKR
jgi:hypothetical protein